MGCNGFGPSVDELPALDFFNGKKRVYIEAIGLYLTKSDGKWRYEDSRAPVTLPLQDGALKEGMPVLGEMERDHAYESMWGGEYL